MIVGQVTGQFKAEEEYMAKYLSLLKGVLGRFENCTVAKIEKSENVIVDALAKLAFDPSNQNNVLIEYLD